MDENKMIKIMLIAALVLGVAGGGFAFYNHQANVAWEENRQQAIAQVEQQQEKEQAAQAEKAGLPAVNESHPARYKVEVKEEAKPEAPTGTQQATPEVKPAPEVPKASNPAPEAPAKPEPIPTQTPPTTTTPPVPPAQSNNIIEQSVPAITSLAEADIKRLQSYPTYGSTGQGLYKNFADFYASERDNAEGFFEEFSPATLGEYKKAKVDWLSTPQLAYRSAIGQICFRGILTVTYFGDNSFGLTPDVMYQREVEYRLTSSVETGPGLALNSIKYLSNWQAVK